MIEKGPMKCARKTHASGASQFYDLAISAVLFISIAVRSDFSNGFRPVFAASDDSTVREDRSVLSQ
jgi:hypothetical protein